MRGSSAFCVLLLDHLDAGVTEAGGICKLLKYRRISPPAAVTELAAKEETPELQRWI